MTRRDLRIAIIGAGPGGMCMAIKLKAAGYDDIVILERTYGVGGTWNRNRYPGCECDVQSELYSFSFEINTGWSRPYAGQEEILGYLERVAETYDVLRHCRFGATVTGARWSDESATWAVEVDGSDPVVADVLVSAIGMFNDLTYPSIEGLDRFAGHHLPQRPVELGSRPRRSPRGGHRQRRQRSPVRPRDREDGRSGRPVPAHRQLGPAQGGRALFGRGARTAEARSEHRAGPPSEAVRPGRSRHGLHQPRGARTTGGARPRGDRRRRRPRDQASAHPDPPVGMQTTAVPQRVLPLVQPTRTSPSSPIRSNASRPPVWSPAVSSDRPTP